MQNVHYSGNKALVPAPIIVKTTTGDAQIPQKTPEYGEFYIISVISRSEGRQEDITARYNSFETGLEFSPAPEGFRLTFTDHPQLRNAGYSLMGPVYHFDDGQSITFELFKLNDQDDIDLPFAVALAHLTPIYHFSMPPVIKAATGGKAAAKKGARKTKSKTYSSSEDDEPKTMVKKKGHKAW